MQTTSTLSVASRLDRLPILPFHKYILVLVGAGLFFDAFDIYLANTVLSALVDEGWATIGQSAAFLSATAFGMLVGSIAAGVLGDLYGRKFTYQFNLLIFGLSSIACAFMPSMKLLIATRFLTGVGLGAELVIGYGLLSEFIPPRYRGRWAALLSCLTQTGLLAATLCGWFVIPTIGWRPMFIIAGVGGLIVFVARKNIPESPRWLEKKGRLVEANAVVSAIESQASGTPDSAFGQGKVQTSTSSHKLSPFDARFRKPLAIGAMTQVVQSASVYGFLALLPTFLVEQGIPINQSLGQSVLMTLGGPVGAFVAFLLADRIGRKPSIVYGSLLTAACGLSFALVKSQILATGLGFLLFCHVYFLVAVVQAGYLPELFPTQVRMRLTSWAVTAGRLASIGIPFAAVFIKHAGGMLALLSAIGGLLVFQALVMLFMAVETSRKSLESIELEATAPDLVNPAKASSME
ncbi:MFS transporter [Paraburkholderia sp.]|uniref:MFS transporter n=1 Tax=Paraburkholderia sp. TaxID=1926495 RepID=UPI003C7ACED1